MKGMLYRLGRFLQLVGLIALPLAIAANLAPEPLPLGTSLSLSAGGIIIFFAGYLMQQAGKGDA
jgi:hypothetical protein